MTMEIVYVTFGKNIVLFIVSFNEMVKDVCRVNNKFDKVLKS